MIFCYSQNGYPKKIQLGDDIVIGLTPEQLKMVNLGLLESEMYKEQLDSSLVWLNEFNVKIQENRQYVNSNLQLIVLLNEQLKTTDRKVENAEKNIYQLKEELAFQKKKTVRLMAITSGVTLSAVSIFYFIAK